MRLTAPFVLSACLVLVPPSVSPQGARKDPAAVLAAAREALGGEKRLSGVKSFTATGRTRQVRGENLVPIEFEIVCELPDKYARKDEIPAQESGPTTTGFNGDALIQVPAPAMPDAGSRPGAPAPPPGVAEAAMKRRVETVKQDFVRLTLGMFATSFSSYPLTFTYGGQAEAPQGKADIIDVKGPGTFALRLFIHETTHLPIMVSWIVQPPPRPAPKPETPAPAAALPPPTPALSERQRVEGPKPLEHRMYYADYRDVDGRQWPFRIRRAIAGETTEETTFDRFRINPKIDPRRFEVRK